MAGEEVVAENLEWNLAHYSRSPMSAKENEFIQNIKIHRYENGENQSALKVARQKYSLKYKTKQKIVFKADFSKETTWLMNMK